MSEPDRVSTDADTQAWLERVLPIIRVRTYRPLMILPQRHEIVGLYADELVVVWKSKSVPIPEAIYESGGAGELKTFAGGRGRARAVPLGQVKSLTSRRRSLLRDTDHLQVMTEEASVRCRVQGDETPNLYRALAALLGPRYDHRGPASLLGIIGRLVLFLTLLAMVYHVGLDSVFVGVLIVLTLVALFLGLGAVIPGRRRFHGKTKPKPTKDLSGREPFRLRIAGSALAALGALFVLYTYGHTGYEQLASLSESELPWYGNAFDFAVLGFGLFVLPNAAFASLGRLSILILLAGFALRLAVAAFALVTQPGAEMFYSVLLILSPYLGLCLINAGRSLVARNARTTLAGDQRPPILYLRSFEDDVEDSLTPHSLLARQFGITLPSSVRRLRPWLRVVFEAQPLRLLRSLAGRVTSTTELQLAGFFREIGPFIAIGKPGERLATIGADRVYVEQDQWQQTVLDYMDRAHFVVLQAARTPGFVWEVRKVLDRVAPEKILFCLSNFRTRQNDYEDFRLMAESTGSWRSRVRWATRTNLNSCFSNPIGRPECTQYLTARQFSGRRSAR